MKYLFLIHQNLSPSDVQALPADEQKQLYADWGAIQEVPGITPAGSRKPIGVRAAARAARRVERARMSSARARSNNTRASMAASAAGVKTSP